MYQCFHCGKIAVIWQSDFSFEDMGYEGNGIIHICHCTNCGAEIEYRIEEKEDWLLKKDGDLYMNVITKSGVILTATGNTILASDGKTYFLTGNILICNGKNYGLNVNSVTEAIGIIAGLYGGKAY